MRETRDSVLLGVINGNGKVLPRGLVDGGRPDLLVLAVEDLPRVLGQVGLAQDGARLEVELVGRVIRGFVPDVLHRPSLSVQGSHIRGGKKVRTHQILVAQIQRSRRVKLDAKMQRLDTRRPGTSGIRIPLELQTSTAESLLGLEDALVAEGNLEGLVRLVVEARVAHVGGELDDLAPFEVLALHVVRIEDGGAVAVKVRELGGGLDAPVEDEGAFCRRVGCVDVWSAGVGQDAGQAGEERKEG